MILGGEVNFDLQYVTPVMGPVVEGSLRALRLPPPLLWKLFSQLQNSSKCDSKFRLIAELSFHAMCVCVCVCVVYLCVSVVSREREMLAALSS